MNRNLKALGLALVAACATCVAFASAAQASEKKVSATCENYPCVITGTVIEHPTIGKVHKFTVESGKSVTCKFTLFDATVEKGAEQEVTVTPTYKECTAQPGNLPATVTMNGCDYVLKGGEVTAGNTHHFENGTTYIKCPQGPPEKKIEVHIYASAPKHVATESQCTITIGTQTVGGNTATNITSSPWDVELVTKATGIAVEVHPEGLICGKTKQTATYTGSTTLEAFEDLGNHTTEGETVYTEGKQTNLTVSGGV